MKDPSTKVVMLKHCDLHPPDQKDNRLFGSGMDTTSLRELADSIIEVGIQQPLKVRKNPKGDGYEIVFGTRRHTAAGLIKLKELPCLIDDLTDAEVAELRLVENLQRVGINEMEEAAGYRGLLDIVEAGKPVHTLQSIAKKVGKSVNTLRARLKLLKLPDVAVQAFAAGKLEASVALLIARIPDPKVAEKAALEILDPFSHSPEGAANPDIEPLSFRRAKEHVQTRYLKRLKGAPFDPEDKDLVPVVYEKLDAAAVGASQVLDEPARLYGGSCKDCPHRTGNMKALFPDMESADVCTHPACFKRKTDAAFKQEAARFAKKGQTLATKGQARELVGGYDGTLTSEARAQYVDLTEKAPGKRGTLQAVLAEHLPKETEILAVRAADQDGKKHTALLVPVAVALAAAKAAKVKLTPPDDQGRSGAQQADRQKEEEAKREAKVKANTAKVATAYSALLKAVTEVKKLDKRFWLFLAVQLCWSGSFNERRGIKGGQKGLAQWLKRRTDAELRACIIDAHCCDRPVSYQGEVSDEFIGACQHFGVKLK